MITADTRPGGVHPKSEIPDQPSGDGRTLTAEWTARL